jgi:hypothetical protein
MTNYKLTAMRSSEKSVIAVNPYSVDYVYKQFYKVDDSLGKVKDGEPVKIQGFKNPIRVFDSRKETGVAITNGVLLSEITKYIMCEYDEEIEYGLQFEYYEKMYEIQTVKEKIKFGGIVSLYAELKDVTEGSLYGR